METESTYSIILPTYNEAENIVPMLKSLASCMRDYNYEIIVIDDNSPDRTFELAVEESQRVSYFNRVHVLLRSRKLGLGTAYKYGLKYSKGTWTILMDSDLSHNPADIPNFIKLQRQTGADIVNGSRYCTGGGVIGWSLYRKFISKTANFIASMLVRTKRTDMTGSFRLYKTNVLRELLHDVHSSGYAFQMETLVIAERKGYKIIDNPIIFKDREYGKSKLGIGEMFKFVWALYSLACDCGLKLKLI